MNFADWQKFEDLMLQLSKQPGYKPKKGEYRPGSPLISPAIYKPNMKRRNDNVLSWAGWAALDVDDYDCTFEEAREQFNDIRHICYSSASSTLEKPKFRIIIPCTRHVDVKDIKHFWFALNKKYNELGDPQTKDLSRMYYVPAQYPNSYQFIFFHRDADLLDPYQLMKEYEFANAGETSFKSKLDKQLQEKLLKFKLNQLNNSEYSWSSYRDCPFVNQTLINEYRTISESGWYHKMYSILCSIAANAIHKKYPITSHELSLLAKQIDSDTGGWYANRPFDMEADRAIKWALENC